jgi:hypothetical protein
MQKKPPYNINQFSENANSPDMIIRPPQPLLDLQYNSRDQNILVGGMSNGQVINGSLITFGIYF